MKESKAKYFTKLLTVFLLSASAMYFIRETFPPSSSKHGINVKIINDGIGFDIKMYRMIDESLKELYDVKYVKRNYDVIISAPFGEEKPCPCDADKVRLFVTSEVAVRMDHRKKEKINMKLLDLDFENYDFLIGFDYIDNPKYMRIPFYYIWHKNRVRSDLNRGRCNPDKKHFACFMATNAGLNKLFDGAHKRNAFFHKLSLYKKVTSGGKYLNNTNGPVPYSDTDKWFSQCKFAINFENQTYPGYNTEKVSLGYINGALPIYNSHPMGLKDVNKDALIYAGDFASDEALIDYIKKLDNDDELYCKKWNQPLIKDKNMDYNNAKLRFKKKIQELIERKLNKLPKEKNRVLQI